MSEFSPTDPTAKSLGEMIRARRTYLGISQDQMARDLGTSQGVISDWELNRKQPYPANLQRIAAYLGLDYHDMRTARGLTKESVLGVPRRLVRLWDEVQRFEDETIADAVLDVLAALVALLRVVVDRLSPRE